MEGRDQLKGNSQRRNQGRTQSRRTLPLNLMRVNEAAKRDPTPRLTWVTLGKSRMREIRGSSLLIGGYHFFLVHPDEARAALILT